MTFAVMPQDESEWASALSTVQIPVLWHTIDALSRLRNNEQRLLARDISRVLLRDPMFTLCLQRFLATQRRAGQQREITTVDHALMMLGVVPFFARFSDLPAVESVLAGNPRALEGVMRVVDRAYHAALYARDWAVLRHDSEPDEVANAALLHDIAEMLLWCFAPELALRIEAILESDTSLCSGEAQRAVLGLTLMDLQRVLIKQWQLPRLLGSLMDETHTNNQRVINVVLAVDLARHSAKDGNAASPPYDYSAIQEFLKLPEREAMERIDRMTLLAKSGRDWYRSEAVPGLAPSGRL